MVVEGILGLNVCVPIVLAAKEDRMPWLDGGTWIC